MQVFSRTSRLTWNPSGPAPYESAWSIFSKVLHHNHLTVSEFVPLISKSDDLKTRNISLRHLLHKSEWIDFDRFGKLLKVSPARLQTGFLDQLHFHHYPKFIRHIRNCHKCFEIGYHCTLFDLPLIKECPWHREPLRELCVPCSASGNLGNSSSSTHFGMFTCMSCVHGNAHFFQVPQVNGISENLGATITGYCIELITWWSTLRQATSYFPAISDGLERAEISDMDEGCGIPYLLGYAVSKANKELFWKFHTSPKKAKSVSWDAFIDCSGAIDEPHYLRDDVGKILRSIRRHLFKRYLRPHRNCIRAIQSLSMDELLNLKHDKVCVTAMAFVLWRMSTEGVMNIEGLSSPRKFVVPLRLMKPKAARNVSVWDKLQYSYYGFYGIFMKLKDTLNRHERVIVSKVERDECDAYLASHYEDGEKSGKCSKQGNGILTIIFPDCAQYLETDDKKCPYACYGGDDIIDTDSFNGFWNWKWAYDCNRRKDEVVRFTYSPRQPRSHYCHICI